MRHRRKSARLLVVGLALTLLVAGLTAAAPGRRLVPDARRPVTATPATTGLAYQDVWFPDAQGLVLRGWWIAGGRTATIVMVHPWGTNRAHLLDRVGYLHAAGYGLLLFDLAGHGESGGDTSSFDWLNGDDVRAAVAYTRSRSPGRVILFGYSLGASLAVEVGSRDADVAAVVEDSGFASAAGVFGANFERVTGLPAGPFALPPEVVGGVVFRVNPWRSQPVDDVATLRKPLLVIVGGADDMVPPAEGMALYRAAPGPKRLLMVPGAGHAQAYETDTARYQASVLSFLRDYQR